LLDQDANESLLKLPHTHPVRRIVVLRPNHRLGNTVLLTPLICELETVFPDAEIELVTAGHAAHAVFAEFRQMGAVHAFPARSYRRPGAVLRLLMSLRKRSFDLAVDPDVRSRAGRFLLGQIPARDRLGFRWGVPRHDRILTHAIDTPAAPAHFAQAPVYLLRSAHSHRPGGEAAAAIAMPTLTLRLSDAERRAGAEYLATILDGAQLAARPLVGIYAHATGAKCYPAAWWSRIIAALRVTEPGAQFVEFAPHDGLPRLAGEVLAIFSTDLRQLGAALAMTSLLVSADCGVMHLASAAGARVLGLFKTTDPVRYAPYGAGSEGIMAADADLDAVVTRIRTMLTGESPTLQL
jgi:ADP-heptose:LPS heptosyltransferase